MADTKEASRDFKAQKTAYNNIVFRSATEAKWAFIFDSWGVKWNYEEKSYPLGDDTSYNPDFHLYGVHIVAPQKAYVGDVWIEVKGAYPTAEDAKKIKTFAQFDWRGYNQRRILTVNGKHPYGDMKALCNVFNKEYRDDAQNLLYNGCTLDTALFGSACVVPVLLQANLVMDGASSRLAFVSVEQLRNPDFCKALIDEDITMKAYGDARRTDLRIAGGSFKAPSLVEPAEASAADKYKAAMGIYKQTCMMGATFVRKGTFVKATDSAVVINFDAAARTYADLLNQLNIKLPLDLALSEAYGHRMTSVFTVDGKPAPVLVTDPDLLKRYLAYPSAKEQRNGT